MSLDSLGNWAEAANNAAASRETGISITLENEQVFHSSKRRVNTPVTLLSGACKSLHILFVRRDLHIFIPCCLIYTCFKTQNF
ncbi:MAG: hypothetical protein ACJAV1_002013 [Paraglaciecola sp.]|jgi:hypothetical protein